MELPAGEAHIGSVREDILLVLLRSIQNVLAMALQ
jgi:hypothetical protein